MVPQVRKRNGKLRGFLLLIAALLALPLASLGQKYVIREYSHGLGNLNINSIVQDHTGYLWVGTENGLYRYDGNQFKRYGTEAGLPERIIVKLHIGMDGTLWVGTSAGLYFERKDETFSKVDPPAPLREIEQQSGAVISSESANKVLVVSQSDLVEVTRTGPESWSARTLPYKAKAFWSVAHGSDGSLWFGCDDSVCLARNGIVKQLGTDQGIAKDHWSSMRQGPDGHIWVRGVNHVGEIDPDSLKFTDRNLPDSSFAEPFPRIVFDKRGRAITAQGNRLCIWEGDHWRILSDQNGLSHFEIQDIFVGRMGSVWMGVVGHGLMRWMARDHWESYSRGNGLRDNLVWGEARDHQGRLWVATELGLNWLPAQGGDLHEWNLPGVKNWRSGALGVGPDGAIWAGGAERLVRIDPNTLAGRQWKTPLILSLKVDQMGRVWLATAKGLWVLDSSTLTSPQQVEDRSFIHQNAEFFDFATDSSGNLWVTSEDGIFRRGVDGWHRLDLGSLGSSPDQIEFDQSGYLWTAGPSQNLMRLQIADGRVVDATQIKKPDILSQEIVSLLADHRGWIWVGQDAGLSVFDGKSWRSFTQEDGLIWNDLDSYALLEDRDGSIWVGTSGGLSHFLDPGAAAKQTDDPPVFSEVTYGDQKLTDGSSIKWNNQTLDISMAILSFRSAHEETVRYRLRGVVGSAWEEARDFSVRYGHLAPGAYTFEAATVDGAGRMLSQTAAFHFKILPRWWQLPSLQAGAILGAVLLLVLLWRWRTRQFVQQKAQLELAVRSRTRELEDEKLELVRLRDQMRHFAEHDGLSGLWNHRIIVDRLKGEVERSRRDDAPLSVILADVDHFKKINDSYGHPFGDRVIKEVSALLQSMVRSYDWVGRYGGEEFLLVLPGASLEHARERAQQVRRAVEEMVIEDDGRRVPVTISLGVASGLPNNYDLMIKTADTALYQAKDGGRNMVVAHEVHGAQILMTSR